MFRLLALHHGANTHLKPHKVHAISSTANDVRVGHPCAPSLTGTSEHARRRQSHQGGVLPLLLVFLISQAQPAAVRGYANDIPFTLTCVGPSSIPASVAVLLIVKGSTVIPFNFSLQHKQWVGSWTRFSNIGNSQRIKGRSSLQLNRIRWTTACRRLQHLCRSPGRCRRLNRSRPLHTTLNIHRASSRP